MRAKPVLLALFLFICIAGLTASAQLPGLTPVPATENQSPALIPPQTPSVDTFNGSGVVDKLVPANAIARSGDGAWTCYPPSIETQPVASISWFAIGFDPKTVSINPDSLVLVQELNNLSSINYRVL